MCQDNLAFRRLADVGGETGCSGCASCVGRRGLIVGLAYSGKLKARYRRRSMLWMALSRRECSTFTGHDAGRFAGDGSHVGKPRFDLF